MHVPFPGSGGSRQGLMAGMPATNRHPRRRFFDAVAVRSRKVSERYLSLDQAMILGAIGNVFGGDIVRRAFCAGAIQRQIRPLIAMEQFSAGIVR